ncbi:histidine phosphatase family protein [Aeromicrobium sp. CF4.19]|uniref:histidine phosphatase family protein n=1 Tax=Aeromicrobium sp. CF4.19 TaxID=3373082 RepID=UPI003EE55751
MRHGESTWNAAGRMQGQDPTPPLTDLGRAQVEEATQTLLESGVTGIVTSPARRATESAAIVATRLGLDVREDPLLVERGLDETWESVEARIRAVVASVPAPGTLLVTHGDVIGYAAHLLAGLAPTVPGNGSVLRLVTRATPPGWRADVLC